MPNVLITIIKWRGTRYILPGPPRKDFQHLAFFTSQEGQLINNISSMTLVGCNISLANFVLKWFSENQKKAFTLRAYPAILSASTQSQKKKTLTYEGYTTLTGKVWGKLPWNTHTQNEEIQKRQRVENWNTRALPNQIKLIKQILE